MIKLSCNLESDSCDPPVKKKVSMVVVALNIAILVALANITISENTGVSSNNDNNDDDDDNNSSIISCINSSVSIGGCEVGSGGGGGGNGVGMVAAVVVLGFVVLGVVVWGLVISRSWWWLQE